VLKINKRAWRKKLFSFIKKEVSYQRFAARERERERDFEKLEKFFVILYHGVCFFWP
jgi:hypothetical protein